MKEGSEGKRGVRVTPRVSGRAAAKGGLPFTERRKPEERAGLGRRGRVKVLVLDVNLEGDVLRE